VKNSPFCYEPSVTMQFLNAPVTQLRISVSLPVHISRVNHWLGDLKENVHDGSKLK
jgi:hypothetical protein